MLRLLARKEGIFVETSSAGMTSVIRTSILVKPRLTRFSIAGVAAGGEGGLSAIRGFILHLLGSGLPLIAALYEG